MECSYDVVELTMKILFDEQTVLQKQQKLTIIRVFFQKDFDCSNSILNKFPRSNEMKRGDLT